MPVSSGCGATQIGGGIEAGRDKARPRVGKKLVATEVRAMRAPASFTGEDVAELHGHGGAHNLERLLAAVIERGARVAQPGEFTRRPRRAMEVASVCAAQGRARADLAARQARPDAGIEIDWRHLLASRIAGIEIDWWRLLASKVQRLERQRGVCVRWSGSGATRGRHGGRPSAGRSTSSPC
jgi:GTP-binding protein TrmE N-terminus